MDLRVTMPVIRTNGVAGANFNEPAGDRLELAVAACVAFAVKA
jgi:hypothetical protein